MGKILVKAHELYMSSESAQMLEKLQFFLELKSVFLAVIKAKVLMNDIPSDLAINYDQTGI